MIEGRLDETYARLGDALASAALCHTAVSALETLLGDAAELLHGAWLVVIRNGDMVATAGPRSGEVLRARAQHLASTRDQVTSVGTWRLVRHTVHGVTDAHLVVAQPQVVPRSAADDAVVRVLRGAVGLALRTQGSARDAAPATAFSETSTARRNRLLELLLQIQRRISHRAPLQEVLDHVVQGASDLLGDEAASIHVLDTNDPGWLDTVAWTGIDDEWLAAIRRVPVGHGASGKAVREQRLVVFENYRQAAGRLEGAVDTGVTAAMAAPVHTDGRTMGAIVVATRNAQRRYSDVDRATLLAFADNVSLALTDAQSLRRVDEALHDPVTGLPTRTLFLDRLDGALGGHPSDLTILFCDL
ncbi:MAG TPA: GAF domain-containing protein, partial [Euzebyales bacterium]|nr:GAF domain-containing protein [Euzebyales bacterium]